ncbi:MAG: RHS repeat domain-containing protein, partial [Pirellula staleyi]
PGIEASLRCAMTKSNGAVTEITYDYQNRPLTTKQYPRVGTTLTSTKAYLNNQLFYDQDPYGRRKYYGYRASDGTLIRTITCTVPEQTFADFAAVWSQSRDTNPNAKFIIHDAIRDAQGRLTQIIDGRGIETRMEYDAQGRETNKRVDYGTSIEARTETVYNAASQVTEVRSPRYFDSTDTNGYQKAREQWTYNGRGKVATHIVAPGTADGATESFTYDLGGRQETHTDLEATSGRESKTHVATSKRLVLIHLVTARLPMRIRTAVRYTRSKYPMYRLTLARSPTQPMQKHLANPQLATMPQVDQHTKRLG